MTFMWTRSAGALVSRCTLCGTALRSLSESAIYPWQRSHTALECQLRRAQPVYAMVDETDVDRCHNGHERAGNTHVDKNGCLVCNACRREKYAAKRQEKEAS